MKTLFNRNQILIFTILIILNINLINACYITNCPWGGKRSQSDDLQNFENTRQCRKCASGLGTCFGPRICCGPEIGCLIDSVESNVCRFEDVKSRVPCVPYGKTCDKVEFGRCATSNLCCNPEHCLEDTNCEYENSSQDENDNYDDESETNLKLLKALNRLIQKKKQAKTESLDLKKPDSHQSKFLNDK